VRRRTSSPSREVLEPPARLLAFEPADWLPQVGPSDDDAEQHRNVSDGVRVGPPSVSAPAWRLQQARRLWLRARLAWCREHGWPGGLTALDLLRQEVAARRREVQW
jgi:hypothetical protein